MRRTLYTVLFTGPLVAAVLVGFLGFLQSFSGDQRERLTEAEANFVADQANSETLPLALQEIKELLKREEGRFKHIDGKANNFFGMFGIALTLLMVLGPIFYRVGKKEHTEGLSSIPQCLGKKLGILYALAFIALLFSFSLAMFATQAVNRETFLGFELGVRYDVNPVVVYGETYIAEDGYNYNRVLLAEYIEVYGKNVDANDLKATWLARAQTVSYAAGLLLLGFVLILTSTILFGPPKETSPNVSPSWKWTREVLRWLMPSKRYKTSV